MFCSVELYMVHDNITLRLTFSLVGIELYCVSVDQNMIKYIIMMHVNNAC